MLHGIIAAFGGRISQETVSITLDDNSNHSIVCARAPERPSSTRWPRGEPLFSSSNLTSGIRAERSIYVRSW